MSRQWGASVSVTWRGALASVSLGLVAACGGTGDAGTLCTKIGAPTGVSFEYAPVLVGHRNETLLVEACVSTTCEHLTLGRENHQHGIGVAPEQMGDATPIPVSLRITTPSGATLYEGHSTARPELLEPNGPECEPHAWSAQLFASGSSRLRQKFVSTK